MGQFVRRRGIPSSNRREINRAVGIADNGGTSDLMVACRQYGNVPRLGVGLSVSDTLGNTIKDGSELGDRSVRQALALIDRHKQVRSEVVRALESIGSQSDSKRRTSRRGSVKR